MDVERRAGLEHVVGALQDLCEGLRVREAAVGNGVQVGEVENGAHPAGASRNREDVLGSPKVPDAAHDLDPERHRAVLALEPLAELVELLDDGVDRVRALAAEQKARVEDNQLGARGLRDPGRMVEHPDRHTLLLVAFDVTHEACNRRVYREHDPGVAGKAAETLRPGVVHPELAFEVDLAGRVAALPKQLDR